MQERNLRLSACTGQKKLDYCQRLNRRGRLRRPLRYGTQNSRGRQF